MPPDLSCLRDLQLSCLPVVATTVGLADGAPSVRAAAPPPLREDDVARHDGTRPRPGAVFRRIGGVVPVRAASRCPRCHRLQTGSGPCASCRSADYADYKWVYSSRQWAALRDQVLSEEPLCAECRAVPPWDIDHIVSLRRAPRLAFVRSNVQGLCKPCHGRKTRREG